MLCASCLVLVDDLDFIVLLLCTVTKDKEHRHGCQGNMVIEGKRQMCARTHIRTYALTHSLSVTAWPGFRIFNLRGLWQCYSIVIRGDGEGYVQG